MIYFSHGVSILSERRKSISVSLMCALSPWRKAERNWNICGGCSLLFTIQLERSVSEWKNNLIWEFKKKIKMKGIGLQRSGNNDQYFKNDILYYCFIRTMSLETRKVKWIPGPQPNLMNTGRARMVGKLLAFRCWMNILPL